MPQNVDLNTVSEQDLERMQGVGKDNAKKIVDFRKQNGPFKSWDDLRRIPGIPGDMSDTLKQNGLNVGGKVA